jgi:chemotaxis signal transduction protein
LLILRAFGIFVSLKNMADVSTIRLVVLRIGDLICAVPAASVREVLSDQSTTRIPGAPSEVLGLLNVRGTLLTVVDGHATLGQKSVPGAEGAVLVIETGARAVGLAVDEVLDLFEVNEADLEPREALPGINPRLARAVGRHGERLFVVLDTDALLAPLLA